MSFQSLQAQTQPDSSKDSWKTGLSVQCGAGTSIARYLNLPEDSVAIVIKVEEGSSASKAGIQIGDVIAKVNGVEVYTRFDIINAINRDSLGATDTVTFSVYRNGSDMDFGVLLESTEDEKR